MDVMCIPEHLRLESEKDTLLVPVSFCNSNTTLPGSVMPADAAAVISAGSFFNPVVLVFLSGFAMSRVMDKYGISARIAHSVLARAGDAPSTVLAAVMTLCVVLSAGLSNVPAAVIGTALVRPAFEHPSVRGTSWPKAALLGVAFSCNIGGMSSPIASPQNIIAVITAQTATRGTNPITFIDWLVISVPFCVLANVVCWFGLVWLFGSGFPVVLPRVAGPGASTRSSSSSWRAAADRPLPNGPRTRMESSGAARRRLLSHTLGVVEEGIVSAASPPRSEPGSPLDDRPLLHTATDRFAGSVAANAERVPEPAAEALDEICSPLASGAVAADARGSTPPPAPVRDAVIVGTITTTIALWVGFAIPAVASTFGNIGLIAVLPIAVFGSIGYLTKADFNELSWDTIILIGGGLSLGTAVESSGLLKVIGAAMNAYLQGMGIWPVLAAFTLLVAVLANFISSTVAAVILLPIIAEVGVAGGHPKMLILLCTFMTSGAMGLPVSSFPNANSMAVRRADLSEVLKTSDYIRAGFPMCAVVFALCNTFGFVLCSMLGGY
jgi:di/tricarboxylate transporter